MLTKFFKRKTKQQPLPVKEKPHRASMFSTDSEFNSKLKLEDRQLRAHESNFQRTVKEDVVFPQGMAADSADGIPIKSNYANAFGNVSAVQLNWFSAQAFIGYQLCAVLAQQWLIAKACSLPGQDALRNGYEIVCNEGDEIDPKILERVKELDEKFKLNFNLEQFSKFNRVFGIRIAMFKIDTPNPEDFYSKPFNLDGITEFSYLGISQIDPYWIVPQLNNVAASDPTAIDFYEPTWWQVNGMRIHKSHLIIIRHDEVADILKPTYLYGGIPLTQQIYERVYAAERTANEAPLLALTKRLNVYKTDLEAAIANQGEFERKIQYQTLMRDNHGVKIIGIEEEAQQFDLNLTDLDVTIMTQYQLTASIANMPAQKLLGTTPKGFNATGEYEESSYHELLETIQTHNFTPLMQRHHEILIRSHICPEFGIPEFNVKVLWEKLDSETSKERAEINRMNAETSAVLIDAGVIDGEDARNQLIADKDSGYSALDADKIIEAPGLEEAFEDDPETEEF